MIEAVMERFEAEKERQQSVIIQTGKMINYQNNKPFVEEGHRRYCIISRNTDMYIPKKKLKKNIIN